MDIKQLISEATDYDKKVAFEIKKPKSWCKSINVFANVMVVSWYLVWQMMMNWLDLTLYNLNYGSSYATQANENVIENVIEISEEKIKIWDIVRLIRRKVITYDDLSDFSDELQNEVKRILEMSR